MPALAAPASPPSGHVRVLVTLDDRVPDVAAAARASLPRGGALQGTWSRVLKGYAATVPAAALPALERAKGVIRVERDVPLRAQAVQPSPPRGLDRIDQRALPLDNGYSFVRTGTGVTAYVLDTGIRLSHSDFGGRAVTGLDVITPGGSAEDCNGHGTHVAGTVGGTRFGVAKSVTLSSVRVLGCNGEGTGAGLIAGLDFVVADHQAGTPAVAVLSLGGETTSRTVDDAVRRLIADGVTVALAAGNAGVDACTISPARVAEALTIGATSPSTDERAPWSNTGSCLDLFAPGVGILSAGHSSDTGTLFASGTSMAAPHVAGAAALLLEADPRATPADVARELAARATSGVVIDAQSPQADLLYVGSLSGAEPPVSPSPEPSPPPSPSASPSPSPSAAPPAASPSPAPPAPAAPLPTAEPSPSASPPASPSPAASPSSSPPMAPPPAGVEDVQGRFTPVPPARSLDTRSGTGGFTGRLAPGQPLQLAVTGRSGVPAAGVTAVVLNVTVTAPEGAGHLTVHPAGGSTPVASNLNHVRGQTVANLVVSGVDDRGRVSIVSNAGRPFVIADVVGYYSDTLGGSRSTALAPARLMDTRSGLGGTSGRLQSGTPARLQVTGRGGVPDSGVTAVVVNVTAVSPVGGGHLTVFPGGQAAPEASSLNFVRGSTVPNLVVVGVGPSGDVQLMAATGVHVVVDVVGWYGGQAQSRYVPVEPHRLLDTRSDRRPLAPGEERVLRIRGAGPLPTAGVTGVLLNVTAVGATGPGHLTVFPADRAAPEASNVNYRPGQTVPNLVLSAVAVPGGEVRIRSNGGSPHVVVDVVGYTTATSSTS